MQESLYFVKKEILAQVFSCEFCEIFENLFFTEHFQWLFLNNIYLEQMITWISLEHT